MGKYKVRTREAKNTHTHTAHNVYIHLKITHGMSFIIYVSWKSDLIMQKGVDDVLFLFVVVAAVASSHAPITHFDYNITKCL